MTPSNAVNEALRKAVGPRRFLKALYRRLSANTQTECFRSQQRLNLILKYPEEIKHGPPR